MTVTFIRWAGQLEPLVTSMGLYLTPTTLGLFIVDEQGEVVSGQTFYPDVQQAVSVLVALWEGRSDELVPLLAPVLANVTTQDLATGDTALARVVSEILGVAVQAVSGGCDAIKRFRARIDDVAEQHGDVPSADESRRFRRRVALTIARNAVIRSTQERDTLVRIAIDAIDELDRTINTVAMRLREWYSIHHPTLSKIVTDHEKYARVIEGTHARGAVDIGTLMGLGLSGHEATQVVEELEWDLGVELREDDISPIRRLARQLLEMYTTRRGLEEYVGRLMQEVAPNITALVGPLVGARLISIAGSLRALAQKPSSTVQVYGAEKALFRSLRTGSAPPKHGIIYQAAEVHAAPYWRRGKVARALAGKLAIAAKVDAFSGRDMGAEIRGAFERRLEEIMRTTPEEPPPRKVEQHRKRPKPARRRGRRKGTKRKTRGGRR